MFKTLLSLTLILHSLQAQPSKVYFTRTISSDNIVEMFKRLNVTLKGRIGLKVHSGEKDGIYYLRPDFLQKIYDYTNGTFIECNTAYENWRHNTSIHMKLAEEHGWYEKNRRFVIMDENPEDDIELDIKDGVKIKKNYVGKHIEDFESIIVLSHFKGHSWGGFGGALKQLSIGFGSQAGKTFTHTAGASKNWTEMKAKRASQMDFTASMGDAASSVVRYFQNKGGIVYISVLVNISKICDCGGGPIVPPPKIHNIGILASIDPVAIDRAALDLVKETKDEGTEDWFDQVYDRKGLNTITVAEKHKIGTTKYVLIDVDGGNPFPEDPAVSIWQKIAMILALIILLGILLFLIYSYFYPRKKRVGLIDRDKNGTEA